MRQRLKSILIGTLVATVVLIGLVSLVDAAELPRASDRALAQHANMGIGGPLA